MKQFCVIFVIRGDWEEAGYLGQSFFWKTFSDLYIYLLMPELVLTGNWEPCSQLFTHLHGHWHLKVDLNKLYQVSVSLKQTNKNTDRQGQLNLLLSVFPLASSLNCFPEITYTLYITAPQYPILKLLSHDKVNNKNTLGLPLGSWPIAIVFLLQFPNFQ